MSIQDKVLETLDQMVLPASTADVYNRMVKLGYMAGSNVPRERADVSSYLGKLRKSGHVVSLHEDGILLWAFGTEAPVNKVRQPTDAVKEIRDAIDYVRGNVTQQALLAEVFDEIANTLAHAANKLRRMQ